MNGQVFVFGNRFQRNLFIDILDDKYLKATLIHHVFHHKVVRLFDFMLLNVSRNQFNKFLTELQCFPFTYTLDFLQLCHSSRVAQRHIFQRVLQEDHEWW
ncbi:hypothetical protein D3C87_1470270 [compost metagenome]